MTTLQELLAMPLFAGLSEEQVGRIAAQGREITCKRGEILFHEGDPAGHLYILLEGQVSLRVHLTSRPESVTVAVLKQPGQAFGWSGIVPPYHYTATALCDTACRLFALEGKAFMAELEKDPGMGFQVMRHVAEVIASRLRNARGALLKTL